MLKLADTKGIRSPGRDIYSVNFADYLPETLKRDPKMKALAAAVTEQMLGVSGEIDNVLIYSRIDELPEELIDILAFDMHVDWYDYSYPLAAKRDILKNSVKVHKKMGTKYAVETALGNVYGKVGISEWFHYGGKPYFFKINIDTSLKGFSENDYLDIVEKVIFYKTLPSHCDGIYIRIDSSSAAMGIEAGGSIGMVLKVKAKTTDSIAAGHMLHVVTMGAVGAALKVKPILEKQIKKVDTVNVLVGILQENRVKIKARMPEHLKGGAIVRTRAYPKTGNLLAVKGDT